MIAVRSHILGYLVPDAPSKGVEELGVVGRAGLQIAVELGLADVLHFAADGLRGCHLGAVADGALHVLHVVLGFDLDDCGFAVDHLCMALNYYKCEP